MSLGLLSKIGNGIIDPIKGTLNTFVVPTVSEGIRILPDSLLFGSGFLSLLTFSPAYFIFFLAILEAALLQSAIGSILLSIYPGFFGNTPGPLSCTQGYKSPNFYRLSLLSLFVKDTLVPNPIMFILSSATFYIMAMYFEFSKEISYLGSQAVDKMKASIFMSCILIFLVALWRVVEGCDSFGLLIISFILGIIGIGIFHVNMALFGRESVNLMALPTLDTTKAAVCNN